jgi:hypothetical protein
VSRRGGMTTLPPGPEGRRLRPVPDPRSREAGPARDAGAAGQAGPAARAGGLPRAGDAVRAAGAPRRTSAAPRAGAARAARGSGQPAATGSRPASAAGTMSGPAPAGTRQRAGVAGLRQQRDGVRPPGGGSGLRSRPGAAGSWVPGLPGTRARPSAAPAKPLPGRAAPAEGAGTADQGSRTPFVFLVLGLLAGGLVSLLLINTVLATGSYQITALQKANEQLAQQRQALRAQIASEETPAVLYRRARQLGMVDPPLTHFLDLRKGRIISQPTQVPGVVYYPPGYTP